MTIYFLIYKNCQKNIIVNFMIQKLKNKHNSLKKYTNWAKLSSLVLREREETKTRYFAPQSSSVLLLNFKYKNVPFIVINLQKGICRWSTITKWNMHWHKLIKWEQDWNWSKRFEMFASNCCHYSKLFPKFHQLYKVVYSFNNAISYKD